MNLENMFQIAVTGGLYRGWCQKVSGSAGLGSEPGGDAVGISCVLALHTVDEL